MALRASETAPHEFLVIDDHPLFCDALTMTLRSIQAQNNVMAANTLEDGLNRLDAGANPDAILLDLNLPDVDGIDGLIRLRSRKPETPVVVISSYDDNRIIASVLRAGAVGFIPKQCGRDELKAAFHRIWRGETYTPPSYQPPSPRPETSDSLEDHIERLSTLTPQQGRILELVCEGKLNKQIAFDLSIAETTVKAHITAILRKLKVHSRTQAVLIAQKSQFSSILQTSPDAP